MVREGGHYPAQMRTTSTARPGPDRNPVFSAGNVSLFPEIPDRLNYCPEVAETRVDPRVVGHYDASAALYKRWSPTGHLHFGYWRWPMNPFAREPMLEALVHEVADSLKPNASVVLADLGCGYGTAARLVAARHRCRITAITAVTAQTAEGDAAAEAAGLAGHVRMQCCDYRRTGIATGTLDGAYAIESLDYGTGAGKADVLTEAARIIRPGGRFSMAGGFLLKEPSGWRARLVRTTTSGWAIDCLAQRDPFIAEMARAGFIDIEVKDITWRLAPSALQGPLLALRIWLECRLSGKRPSALERAHLRSCMAGTLLGMQHDLFRYLIITARKAP